MGILSDLNEKRKKAQRKLKDEFLGFTSSVSRKFVPKELRRVLPFASGSGAFFITWWFYVGWFKPCIK